MLSTERFIGAVLTFKASTENAFTFISKLESEGIKYGYPYILSVGENVMIFSKENKRVEERFNNICELAITLNIDLVIENHD